MLLIENMIVVMFAFKLSWNEMHIYFIFLLNYRLFRYIKNTLNFNITTCNYFFAPYFFLEKFGHSTPASLFIISLFPRLFKASPALK